MKWVNNKIIGFGIFLPVLLSVFFVSSSYAISDYTVTIDNQVTLPYLVCVNSNPDLPNCSDYSYIIFSFSSDSFTNYQQVNFTYSGTTVTYRIPRRGDSIFSISGASSISVVNNVSVSFDITLTESLPQDQPCPEPEEPEPCPTCPVVPDNPYDTKLDNIVKAIYICAGTILVLYFFYIIYGMIIKGSK